MIFIGDCHGKTSQLEWMLKHNPKLQDKKCFQLGDMGLGFKGVELNPPRNHWFRFIRGNHDSPQKCVDHPNYAGDYGYDPKEKLFWCGGAWSIDWQWRTPGISWWVDEEQSPEALNQAYQLYIKSKPRIVATHEAPTEAAIRIIAAAMVPPSNEELATSVVKSEEYQYYKAKLGCKNTRTSQVLQQMFDAHKPEYWVFGHYHLTKEFDIEGCNFQCLAELVNMEITLDEEKA